MNKKSFFLLFFTIALLFSSLETVAQKYPFELMGHITGLKNDSIFIYARVQDGKGNVIKVDTFFTVANNERFTIKGVIENPSYAQANIGKDRSSYFTFILEKGKIKVEGDMTSIQDAAVTGTPDNDIIKDFAPLELAKYKQIRALYKSYDKEDKVAAGKAEDRADSIRNSIASDRMEFIRSHPNAMYSGTYIYVLQDKIPLEKLESLYNGLSDRIKNNNFGRYAAEKIIARKRTAIGNAAPAFAIDDIKGNQVTLGSLKGKYVLLEFWASWCVPCRQEIPAIKEAYQKFKEKGFVIVGVSVDTDKAKWIKALEEENLPWANVRDILGTESSIAKLYGVQPIPDNFLISPDGKIIARALRGKELENKLSSIYNN